MSALARLGRIVGGTVSAAVLSLALLPLLGGPVAAQTAVRIFGTLSGAPKAVAVDSTGRLRVVIESGGADPGGSDTQVQFNDAGVFGGDAGLTFDKTTDLLTLLKAAIGVTSARGVVIENTTAAAAGAQQYSPMACQEGQGWKTDATAASQPVEFCWEVQTVQGTSAPTGNFILKRSINGGAFTALLTVTSAGQFRVHGSASNVFEVTHNGTNATLSNNSGTVNLVASTGSIVSLNDGHLLWITDNSRDIGASGATRPRTGYFGTSVVTPAIRLANLFISATAPSSPVACTSPAISWSNGTAVFQIDVGTSCTGVSTLAVTLPTATNGWECSASNVTTAARNVWATAWTTTSVTLTNTDRTTGLAADFADGADIRVQCSAG